MVPKLLPRCRALELSKEALDEETSKIPDTALIFELRVLTTEVIPLLMGG
jgi:hypothetical protein